MEKITTEIRYKQDTFTLISEKNELRLFFSQGSIYGIIVDKKDNVLFEISADCSQNSGFLQLGFN